MSVPLLPAGVTNLTVTNLVFASFSASTQVRGGALGMYPYGASETWFLSDYYLLADSAVRNSCGLKPSAGKR